MKTAFNKRNPNKIRTKLVGWFIFFNVNLKLGDIRKSTTINPPNMVENKFVFIISLNIYC